MTDVHSKSVRSFNMSQIKGKDTKPEMIVRKYLFSQGLRFRLHKKELPGKPDICLPKYKTVIFIHGCFWHGHVGCKYYVIPKTRTDWWLNKINRNIENDIKATSELRKMRWNVIEIWECQLKKANLEETLENLLKEIKSY
ncbi:very short patch repair endonuclease [Gynurincola endophyticus]|uniref:very short patch repair endonuclease n=1 Tax=Gynurincola endophyticus TaxID=2479004 RepID=UPI000F8CA707|nr:DNA mismatch endonuclease Vsr [Gynurincola endophyticus]